MRIKDFAAGALTVALAFSVLPTAFAKVSKENINVSYNNIKIVVDGKQVQTDKEPFIYDGTTYLPVRAVGEAVGKEVAWDGNTQTVTLTGGSSAQLPAEEKAPAQNYSRTNPAPIGTAQLYERVSKYTTSYSTTIKITDVLRGSAAWTKIKEANMFNDEAPEGKEYILAKISATVHSVSDDKAVSFSDYDFTAFSSSNVEYENPYVVAPEPELTGSVYSGGTTAGYVVFMVDKSDASPKVVYGNDYDGTGGIWFKLTK